MDDKKKKDSPREAGKKEDKEQDDLKKKVEDLEDQLKRTVADYRNYEKRLEEEKKESIKFANRELLLKLMPAFDTLFRAEKYVEDEGLKLSIKKLTEVLKDAGVEKIETDNKTFDPNFMECIDIVEGQENKVIEEITPGFTLYGKVLRPAQVKVGKKSEINKRVEDLVKEAE